ncbi:MAG: response regulator [candidate division Zixibacteria bacterium]|nr:response regulator [candidate division Zixibacteria bacterium]
MNILIVDDIAINRKLLRATLEAEGNQTFEAVDGVEALEMLSREKIDAVITDILMPRMDGYQLCHEVRKNERLKSIPFIIYSATYNTPLDQKLALDLGTDRFIQKPASAKLIMETLLELTGKQRSPAERPAQLPRDMEMMREYSRVLSRKVEEKNKALEQAENEIAKAYDDLEQKVIERTAQLKEANAELESFSHSVAHDLRAPLRIISAYSRIVTEECGAELSPKAAEALGKITKSATRMNDLIDALLQLSRLRRYQLNTRPVNLSALANNILQEMQQTEPGRSVEIAIEPELVAQGDEPLLRSVLENLLGNAWKFTGKQERGKITFGSQPDQNVKVYFVRDNGAGFEMSYAEKLFRAFERLHSQSDFPGTGVGLATVQRIIHMHGGRIWADSEAGKGATFYFTLQERKGTTSVRYETVAQSQPG